MSLVRNLLAGTLGLRSKRKRLWRHWDIEREQGCSQARTVAEARMSFKRALGTSCFVEPAGTPFGELEGPEVLRIWGS